VTTLTELEQAVLDKLLDGEHVVLAALRRQLEVAGVIERVMTGVGFHTSLAFPEASKPSVAPLTQRHVAWGDVAARIPGLQHGAGFVLFIRDGYLDTLEGYTFDEPWPESIASFELEYNGGAVRDLSQLCRA
jgi:hypothetical protein